MTTVAAIKGKIGELDYFQCTLKIKDLISRTECAVEYFSKTDWDEMGPTGQMQRVPDKRVITHIAPYILKNKKRFFNSIVVALDPNLCKFRPLDDFAIKVGNDFKPISSFVDFEYEDKTKTIGFLTIKDVDHMLILDGQHRMLAYRAILTKRDQIEKVLQKTNDTLENYKNHGFLNDDISVIFVNLQDIVDQRKLFGDLNTYAKSLSAKERNLISEDNGYRKILQNFLDQNPLKTEFIKYVNLSGTSLPTRAKYITTVSHLREMIIFICKECGYNFPDQGMPSSSDLDKAEKHCREFLSTFFSKIKAFEKALLSEKEEIQQMREASCKDGLLFKPMPKLH